MTTARPWTDADVGRGMQKRAASLAMERARREREAREELARRRKFTPPHVDVMVEAFTRDRHAWELAMEEATRGNLGGQEEADYRREHPAPALGDYMRDQHRYVVEARRRWPAA